MLPKRAIAAFVSQLDEPTRQKIDPAELQQLWEAARRAWPSLQLEAETFCSFFGSRVARAGGVGALQIKDLYLACACLEGDAAALRAFDALLDEVGRKLRGMAQSDDRLDEAKQIVRQVLVARADRPAPIGEYSGRGELGGWLRIALGRELVRLQKRGAREPQAADDELAALANSDDNPETTYLKTHYQKEFKESFAVALGRLAKDELRALRYSVVERFSIDDIAKLDGVHRATAARQLARARARLTEETRRAMGERLQIDTGELQSVLRLIESQVDVSVRRLLDS